MKIVRNRKDLINYLNNIRINNQVGLIPTMGSIHQGHLSLIKQSVKNKYITCVSIFINPTQFNRTSDFKSYPRSEKKVSIIQILRRFESLKSFLFFCYFLNIIFPKIGDFAFERHQRK